MVKIAIPNFCINFLNKTEKSLPILCDFAVTSLADAWIKMQGIKVAEATKQGSHPLRMRGLKCQNQSLQKNLFVASFVGAWIKIRGKYIMDNVKVRRTSHGCVD